MSLPDPLPKYIEPDELVLSDAPHRTGKDVGQPFLKRVIGDLNGETVVDNVELEIGGEARIPQSRFDWVVRSVESQRMVHEDQHLVNVDLVDPIQEIELSLVVVRETGKIEDIAIPVVDPATSYSDLW